VRQAAQKHRSRSTTISTVGRFVAQTRKNHLVQPALALRLLLVSLCLNLLHPGPSRRMHICYGLVQSWSIQRTQSQQTNYFKSQGQADASLRAARRRCASPCHMHRESAAKASTHLTSPRPTALDAAMTRMQTSKTCPIHFQVPYAYLRYNYVAPRLEGENVGSRTLRG
jgi:hypothetical protein